LRRMKDAEQTFAHDRVVVGQQHANHMRTPKQSCFGRSSF
jgi:hypothetical protein